MARFDANLAAIHLLRQLRDEDRQATAAEQSVLARWGSWGAQGLSQIFDESRLEHSARRAALRAVLSEPEYEAARRSTINAHYTNLRFVEEIWTALYALQVSRDGLFLEPGCGAGVFIGASSSTAQFVGVELDPTTSAIAQHLYPDAEILNESFATTRLPADHFDAVIGNVPFADVRLHDPCHNPAGYSIHNHFILKSLHLTRPGGIVAVLTSHFTLDSQDSAHRRDIHELADLIGAVRLPTGAHASAAGTEAVTDLLLLRRRPVEAPLSDDSWLHTTLVDVPSGNGKEQLRLNRYFIDRPEHLLGTVELRVGMHGVGGLHVEPHTGQDVQQQLRAALNMIVSRAAETGLLAAPREAGPPTAIPQTTSERDGHIDVLPGGGFTVVSEGVVVALDVPAKQAVEVRSLLRMRDLARSIITAESDPTSEELALEHQRAELRSAWERYVQRYGPINRFTLTQPKDPTRRPSRLLPPAVRLVTRTDPYGALVASLERFDTETQTAQPAGLLLQRQIVPREAISRADSPSSAVSLSLDMTGKVDLPTIASLLDCTPEEARTQIHDLVFEIPDGEGEPGRLVTRAEYLSGNVRAKLAEAEAAAAVDQRWEHNVNELRQVMPADLGPGEITAALGAVWIPADDHAAFMREVLQDPRAQVTHVSGSTWIVEGNNWSPLATHDWGTDRMPAPEIIQRLMTQKQIIVKDHFTDPDGHKYEVLNTTATEAAQEKAEHLAQRFAAWVWEDPERSARLQAEYNRRFNSVVLRDYTAEGGYLTFPGLVHTFTPRAHQRAAVARMLNEPSVGLFHDVGAGKTAEMILGATELKRLGMVQKPAVVVPNHMLEQFSREWLQLYPHAALLAAGTNELNRQGRRNFVAQAATNDWDGIILTRSAFQSLSLTPRRELDYVLEQNAQLHAALERLQGSTSGKTQSRVKSIEKQVLRREEQLKAKLDVRREPGISFEETGIDYLLVDELHDYKNLAVASSIPGAAIDGSARAQDLDAKLWYLRGQHGERVVTGATATPIANSVTEMYVMQRYLAPEQLRDAGLVDFDSWAATFGEVVTSFEANVTGDKFQLKARFARFNNVPELLAMFHSFGDVQTAKQLQLPVPNIAARSDGQHAPRLLTVPKSAALEAFIQELSERVDKVHARQVDPSEDNMLKIASDGRLAALDMRLVGDPAARDLRWETSKLDVAAAEVARVWQETKDNEYLDPATGVPSPIRGGLQLIFCDLSTPSAQWNVYDALRDELHDRGLPPGSVRFIHEASTDEAKARLFAQARAGHISVLIGSTAKMGTGTNVQDRVVHLMHLDAPWRPADVTQREGRAIRQGNQNDEVTITQVVTEGSFDTYMWQTLERKGRFIDQIMRGSLDGGRDIEEVSEATLTYGEIKAIASGNPLLLQQAEAQAALSKLTRLHESFKQTQLGLRHTISRSSRSIDELDARHAVLTKAIQQTSPTTGDRFTMTIGTAATTSRAQAADLLQSLLMGYDLLEHEATTARRIATLGGHDIRLTNAGNGNLVFSLAATGESPAVVIPFADLANPAKGLLTRLENLVGRGLEAALAKTAADLGELRDRLEHAEQNYGLPFPRQTELEAAKRHYHGINEQIAQQSALPETEPNKESTMTDNTAERDEQFQRAHRPQTTSSTMSSERRFHTHHGGPKRQGPSI